MNTQPFESADKWHEMAMDYCDKAVIARFEKDTALALTLFEKAFELEFQAARQFTNHHELEPTRSVLHRSAAWLAMECGHTRTAEQLISSALAGEPPDEIADELRDLLEQVHFARHLETRGIELAEDEFQLSISGKATGYGMAPADQFVGRVQASEKLIIRTIERKSGRPFRETGRAISEISGNFELYLSVPRAASFAVTLRVGRPYKQPTLPGFRAIADNEPGQVIDDLFACLDSYENSPERLDVLIPDETYRRNFVALAERLAPDGDRVRLVGLTALRGNEQIKVAMSKTREEIRELTAVRESAPSREVTTVTGTLLLASSKFNIKKIEVIDDDRKSHKFVVPEGMMADIVKPLWEERVIARGIPKGKSLQLEHIEKSSLYQNQNEGT